MLQNNEYTQFLVEIKAKIREAQYAALQIVNTHLTQLYWEVYCGKANGIRLG